MVNRINNENPLKAKLGIFIEEQGATSVESLWKRATGYKMLRTIGLNGQRPPCCYYKLSQRGIGQYEFIFYVAGCWP